MEVQINEIVSSIRTVDQQQLLSPKLIERLVQEVMRAMDERDAHRRRVAGERKITSGVRDEQEGEAE
jgi:hypothetical protein